MPNSIKSFTERNLDITFLNEYFREKLQNAEFGYLIYNKTSTNTHITLKVGRVGLAIGRRGKNIKDLSSSVRAILKEDNVQIEVEPLDNPEAHATVMAQRLASSLERGRHFRRSAYGILRRVMATGAIGCEIMIAGKITSQRARVESFKEGFIAKTGDTVDKYVDIGYARAKIKRGTLGVKVLIMSKDAVLPDEVNIIAEPTHKTSEITSSEVDEEFSDLAEDLESVDEEIFDDLEDVSSEGDEDIPDVAMEPISDDDTLDEDLEEDLEELED